MIKLLAPGWPRGCSRLLLAIALGASWPVLALAQRDDAPKQVAGQGQDQTPTQEASKGPAAVGRDAAQKKEAAVDLTKIRKVPPTEVWKDPNAEAALKVDSFKELRGPGILTQNDVNAVLDAASRPGGSFERGPAQKYITYYAAELTKHANIEALLSDGTDGNGNALPSKEIQALADKAKNIQKASQQLYEPLARAAQNKNANFRTEYVKLLVPSVQQLLKNHLFARIEGMVVLSRSGEPEAIPVFIDALKDPEQVMAVKVRAAVGIAGAADWGRRTLDPASRAIPAARALAGFLEDETEIFWPVKARALEALGALRQSTENPLKEQADFATVAMKYLADPKARPEVRASAAWALGMMRYNRNTRLNFPLVVHEVGEVAADLGTRIVEIDPEYPGRTKQLADSLVTLIVALEGNGDPGIDQAGLLRIDHPRASAARATGDQVDKQIRELAKAAIELSNGPAERKRPDDPAEAKKYRGNPRAPYRTAVSNQVNALKSYLAKNPPESRSLVPGGPEFPGPKAQVAAGEKR